MISRKVLSLIFLLSYTGAIAHGIIPHHHHASQQEVKEHHHHDHHGSHSHHDDQNKSDKNETQGSLFLFTHGANGDILITHTSLDGAVKSKKAEKAISDFSVLAVLSLNIQEQQVFHPPDDDPDIDNTLFFSRALRAPPVSL
jgi:hypothetical protein